MKELLDGRDQEALARELRRCAAAVFGGDTEFVGPREIIEAMLGVAARIGEEVTQRLDRVPEKQAANFHAAMGADRAPPVPATVPVAVTPAATAPAGLAMPAGTRLQATTDADPITFETLQGMTLLRGAVQRVCAADLEGDRIVIAPPSVAAPALPRPEPIRRVLASAAAAGATKLQIDPATGLAAGMVISFGDPALEADHEIVEVEGDLVTVEPSVATTVPQASEVREVTRFSPWQAGARNRQSHRLYLGHSTLLDLPSATTIFVSGVVSDQADIEWAWFGKLADSDPEPIWHAFADPHIDERDRWVLDKPKGKPEKTPVGGRQGLWLRATLDGGSDGPKTAKSIRIAAGACEAAGGPGADPGADFEAVAVTTPVVRAKPFHPFGREPRIYDSFYVGCNEVFGKAGAKAWLAFTLGGAVLGPMAAVTGAASVQLFAVGTDGLLYRARLDGTAPRFETLALPTELEQIGFPSQAVVTARIVGGRIALAVADRGSVYTTVVDIDPGTAPGRPVWQRLAGDAASADLVASSIFIAGDGVGTVLALCGGRLLTWTQGSGEPQLKVDEHAIDLIPVQNFNGELSVLVRTDVQGVHGAPGDWEVFVWVGSIVGAPFLTTVPANSLPETMRAAWAQGNDIFVAGFATAPGPAAPLELVRLSSAGLEPAPDDPGTYEPRPIGLEPPYDAADLWPVLVLATPVPTRIALHPRGAPPALTALTVAGEADIGASGNAARRFAAVSGWTVVQHPDRGIFYRRNVADPLSGAGEHAIAAARLGGSYVLAANDGVLPGDPAWVAFVGAAGGAAYRVIEHTVTHDRLLLPGSPDAVPSPGPDQGNFPAGAALRLRAATGVQNTLTVNGTAITLVNGYDPNANALHLLIESADSRAWIWLLSRTDLQSPWTAPAGFDPTPGTAPRAYTALETIADGNPSPVLGPGNSRPYFAAPTGDVAKLRSAGPARDLFAGGTEIALDEAIQHDGDDIFPIQAGLIENRAGDTASLWVALRSAAWSLLGPNQPANPELSWEYWNGSSWWALAAATLADSTADLLASGDITFAVPPDMAETDVGGRKNRWLRARLIGGDYGEARVTVISEVVNPTTTKQSVSRDLSAIRAPHVIDLKVTYCTTEALVPEIVLAADNLGVVDQTNANDAGLPVRFFLPVSAALDPQRQETAGDATGTGECCERWEDGRATSPTEPAVTAPLPGRLILLALDQAPKGDVVSLYIDAEPTGGWAKLAARVFRAGAFAAVEIIEDATSGLNESGTLTLRVAEAPDRTELFGLSAFWLALAPATAAAASWSPRLRGIHLNGVMAASVETRRNEPIGSSSGAPDQRFSLVAPPVDPESLALWISEPLGTREADDLGAEKEIEGMPGPWVKWKRKPELPVGEAGVPERVFTLNALTGEIRFGDGRNALIPPPGSALLARSYTHVVGEAANGVAAGAQLQPVSPVAGVDKVKALDLAGGGADAETIEQALARAPAKLRHGDRPVTLADVEEYVRSRLPRVAQAVAENRRGRARLVIAERGETIVPAPATLRGIQADVAGVAAYGIAVRLDVTGPRLLPVRVEIAVEPDRGVDAATTFGRVRAAVLALFDHETGGHDGRGWPIGARPEPADIAAALARAELAETATIHRIAIARAGNRGPLPDPLPIDVLACVSDADVIVEPAGEAVA